MAFTSSFMFINIRDVLFHPYLICLSGTGQTKGGWWTDKDVNEKEKKKVVVEMVAILFIHRRTFKQAQFLGTAWPAQ